MIPPDGIYYLEKVTMGDEIREFKGAAFGPDKSGSGCPDFLRAPLSGVDG